MASIFFRTAIIFLLLSISMKVMGKREIGELEVGELITTLLLSEICSIPIDDADIPLMNAVIPVIFIVSLEVLLSATKNKSMKLKRFFDGEPVFLIKNGVINQQELRKNRISIEEFFSALRQNGKGRLLDVKNCILEANGKISVLEEKNGFDRIVISDGEISKSTLTLLGLNEEWLKKALKDHKPEEVFIMTVNEKNVPYYILKEEIK